MSIWKYFKRIDNESTSSDSPTKDVLPDPEGPLSVSVPTGAIVCANKMVAEVTGKSSPRKPMERGPYLMLTKDQKLLIAQRAAEHGTTSAIRFFAEKYPKLSLKELTVRCLKEIYQAKLREQPGAIPSADIFIQKKTGRPLMIGKELDKQVQDYITYMRLTGTAVNTAVVIACAKGKLLHEAPDLLSRVNLNKG